VEYVLGDMRNFSLGRQFALIFGSPREFGQVAILGGFPDFLKSDIFRVGHGHASGFQ
jgi:hypothetical protein